MLLPETVLSQDRLVYNNSVLTDQNSFTRQQLYWRFFELFAHSIVTASLESLDSGNKSLGQPYNNTTINKRLFCLEESVMCFHTKLDKRYKH